MIPDLRVKLTRVRDLYASLADFREESRAASQAADSGGGGMPGGSAYVETLYEVGKLTTEIGESGVQIKDYQRGLIDFPAMKGERVVLLCWQLGEGDQIEWWHEIDGGFAGRQPL